MKFQMQLKITSIKTKIACLLLATALLVLVPLSIFHFTQTRDEVLKAFDISAEITLKRLSENLRLPLWELDKNWIDEVISTEMMNKDIFAIVVESEGEVYIAKRRDEQKGVLTLTDLDLIAEFEAKHKVVLWKKRNIGRVSLYMTPKHVLNKVSLDSRNVFVGAVLLSAIIILMLRSFLEIFLLRPLDEILAVILDVADGDYSHQIQVKYHDEIGQVAKSIQRMSIALQQFDQMKNEQIWLQNSIVDLSKVLTQEQDKDELNDQVLTVLCQALDVHSGALYLLDKSQNEPVFMQVASFAFNASNELKPITVKMGEGLLGQAAEDFSPIVINGLNRKSLVDMSEEDGTLSLVIIPFAYQNVVNGLLEFTLTDEVTEIQIKLLNQVQEDIAMAYEHFDSRQQLKVALQSAQILSQELRVTNDRLIKKTQILERQTKKLRISEEQSKARAIALEESNTYKANFLANMSHELRTPLNSLLILARLLAANAEAHLDKDEVESAQIIVDSGEELLRLINNILDLSKVDSGHMERVDSVIPMAKLVDVMRKRFKPLALENKLDFIIDLNEDVPDAFVSDEEKLEQILTNLIGNAIKFTRSGNVRLKINYDFDENQLQFSVLDTGVGVPPDQFEMIFSAFQQGYGDLDRRYGGTGLGLSIVQAYVELLGGRISLTSTLGQGSCFSFTLAFEAPESFDAKCSHNNVEEAGLVPAKGALMSSNDRNTGDKLKGLSIMIVDDDMRAMFVLSKFLRKQGAKSILAGSISDALDTLNKEAKVDLILMDIMMPEMDGYEAIKRIKAQTKLKDISIIVITAKATIQMSQLDVDGILTKPIDLDNLLKMIINRFPLRNDTIKVK